MKNLTLLWLLMVGVIYLPKPSYAPEATDCDQWEKLSGRQKTGLVTAIGGSTAITAAAMSALHTTRIQEKDDEAKKEGRTHIGFGVFHDYEKGLNALTAEEKKRVRTAVTPAEKMEAAEVFFTKLTGGTDTPPETKYVEQLFSKKEKGDSRVRAAVLAALLNDMGVTAIIEMGQPKNSRPSASDEMWVHLPEHDLIWDPARNVRLPREVYLETYTKTNKVIGKTIPQQMKLTPVETGVVFAQ